MTIFDRLRYEPRRLIVAVGVLAALLVVAVVAVVIVHLAGGSTAAARPGRPGSHPVAGQTTAAAARRIGSATEPSPSPSLASDVAGWDARPTIAASTSPAYPAITASARHDATGYARAFATELFTRDYRIATRAEPLGWVQYEDSPLRSANYPRRDWTKVLADSLTDLSWDGADSTPIPADGAWLALRAAQARDTVSDVRVSLDPQWEQRIAAGYQPPDPLATERDVSLTVTQRTVVSGRPAVARYSVSLDLQLGTAVRGGGYGVATTNNYVIAKVS